jgi:MOSC domain-containing protein YiiM
MSSHVHSINVSQGGVPKEPVPEARVTAEGLELDRQRNRRYHGGPGRAVCLFSLELIEALRAEGHPIGPGSVGENLTVSGLPWNEVVPGVRLIVGEVELEITSFTKPCQTIRNSFRDNYIVRISERHNPGWSRVYAKVLREGMVRVGDSVVITSGADTMAGNLELFQISAPFVRPA